MRILPIVGVTFLFTLMLHAQPDVTQRQKIGDTPGAAVPSANASRSPSASLTVPVAAGSDLQAALDAAAPGSTLLVEPGTYGTLILRKKPDGLPVTVKVAVPLSANVRVQRTADLIRVRSDGGSPIRTDRGAHDYILDGFAPQPFGDGSTPFVSLGTGEEVDPADLPNNIELRHFVIVADPEKGGRRAVAANSRNTVVRDSYIAGFWFSQDSQCVAGYNGPGPFLIENNYCEASGENVMFGGADEKSSLMQPRNITIRGNYLTKPILWKGKAGATNKNSLEIKNGVDVLIENNIVENSWNNGQDGFCALFTPRNSDGRAPCGIL